MAVGLQVFQLIAVVWLLPCSWCSGTNVVTPGWTTNGWWCSC